MARIRPQAVAMGPGKEAEPRAIAEEVRTEGGVCLRDGFKGNQNSSGTPRSPAHVGQMLVTLPETGPALKAASSEEKIISPWRVCMKE